MARLVPAKIDKHLIFRQAFTNLKEVVDSGGVVTGAPTINGRAIFSAGSSYINYSSVRPRKNFTELTFRWRGSMDFGLNYQTVFAWNNGSVGWGDFTGILRYSNSNEINFSVGDDSSYARVGTGALVADQVYDIVGVWSGGDDLKIYVDGVDSSGEVVNFGTVTTIPASQIAYMYAGTLTPASYNGNSVCDLVEIYDVALTAEEVKDLYEQDTYSEPEHPLIDLPLRSNYEDGSGNRVTENKGSLGGTATLGDGTTASTFPTQLSPHGMSFDGGDYLTPPSMPTGDVTVIGELKNNSVLVDGHLQRIWHRMKSVGLLNGERLERVRAWNKILTPMQIRKLCRDIQSPYSDRDTQTWMIFNTTDTTQDWPIINVNVGVNYRIDWGDGTVNNYVGTGGSQNPTHNYAGAGTYLIKFSCEDPTALVTFRCNANSLTGNIPDLSANTALVDFHCGANSLTGSIPDLSANTALVNFYCHANSLTGSIPDLSTNTALEIFHCGLNSLTGNIPSLSANTDLENFYCYSNSLTGSIPSLSANTDLVNFYCYSNSLTGNIPSLSANTDLVDFRCYANSLTGSIPDLSANTVLVNFYCNSNALTGSIPDLSANTALENFHCNSNSLTGNIPDLSANTALVNFYCYSNSLTGSIPSLSANTALVDFRCYENSLTGYTASTLSPTITTFNASTNALSQTAVDQILIDFTTNAGSRPGTGTINLSGGTNAVPTPAIKAACVAALPGWTITTN